MFNTEKNKITSLEKEVESLRESVIINNLRNSRDVERLKEEYEYSLTRLKVEHDDEIKSIRFNEEKTIEKAVIKLKAENDALSIKTQTQAKEIEMYTKAFENLGFDVKDMKEILNKLVDGLIAKNEIKLVK